MADLGTITEIINASECVLKENGKLDTYIMLQNLNIHIGRPEFRDPTTDAGALYTYGKGDHWMTFTLVATTPEISTIAAFNDIDANGDLNSGTQNDWVIEAKDLAGTLTATFTCSGYLVSCDVRKAAEGKVFMDCFVRITADTAVVATA